MNKATRLTVKKRANYLCEYCLCPEYYSPDPFECEHIIPLAKDGNDDLINLALSCSGCNGHKGDAIQALDSGSAQVVPLYNPRQDKWSDHFRWDEAFTEIIGVSPIGRSTVLKLKLNRPNVVNLRRILRQVGEFPISNFDF